MRQIISNVTQTIFNKTTISETDNKKYTHHTVNRITQINTYEFTRRKKNKDQLISQLKTKESMKRRELIFFTKFCKTYLK